MSYKSFQLPTQKGTDLWPTTIQPPQSVKVQVILPPGEWGHLDGQAAETVGQRMLNDFQNPIRYFTQSQRHNYSLGVTALSNTEFAIPGLHIMYQNLYGMEEVRINLYPSPEMLKKKEDELCLLVLYESNKIAAILMKDLPKEGETPTSLSIKLKKELLKSDWGPTSTTDNWLDLRSMVAQYKYKGPRDTEIPVIMSPIKVGSDYELIRDTSYWVTTSKFDVFVDAETPAIKIKSYTEGDVSHFELPLIGIDETYSLQTAQKVFKYADKQIKEDGAAVSAGDYTNPNQIDENLITPDAICGGTFYYAEPATIFNVKSTWNFYSKSLNTFQAHTVPTTTSPSYAYESYILYATMPENTVTEIGTPALDVPNVPPQTFSAAGDFFQSVFKQVDGFDQLSIRAVPVSWTIDLLESGYHLDAVSDGYTYSGTSAATYGSQFFQFIYQFPPSLSSSKCYQGLFEMGEAGGGRAPKITVITPYETIETTRSISDPNGVGYDQNIDMIQPWLHLSNGEHVIQGFGYNTGPFKYYNGSPDRFLPDPQYEEIKVYCNKVEISEALALALETEVEKLRCLFMDIPLSEIKKFK
jgi:hypothetical protein